MSLRVLPQSVQFVFEDRPLLRVTQSADDVIDFELNNRQMLGLAWQALAIAYNNRDVT